MRVSGFSQHANSAKKKKGEREREGEQGKKREGRDGG